MGPSVELIRRAQAQTQEEAKHAAEQRHASLERAGKLRQKVKPLKFMVVDPYSGRESVFVEDRGETVSVKADHQKVSLPVHVEQNSMVNAFNVAKGFVENPRQETDNIDS